MLGKVHYAGFEVPENGWKVPVVSEFPESAEEFWQTYMMERRPVIFSGRGASPPRDMVAEDLGWAARERWTNDYMADKVGNISVSVEKQLANGVKRFGISSEHLQMPFFNFLDDAMGGISKGKGLPKSGKEGDLLPRDPDYVHYMNLQSGIESAARAMGRPMSALSADIRVPHFILTTPLHAINLWLGNSPSGQKSQMHQDGSDNLYVVVKGRKTFNIFRLSASVVLPAFVTHSFVVVHSL